MSDSLQPQNSSGQNTGVGSLSLLQGIFLTQGLNPGLPHCGWILHQLNRKGSPRILEWVAYPFSSGSSRPRNRTGVSCITGGFFTSWAIREALCLLHIVSAKQFPFYLFFLPSLPPLFTFSNLQKCKNYFQLTGYKKIDQRLGCRYHPWFKLCNTFILMSLREEEHVTLLQSII